MADLTGHWPDKRKYRYDKDGAEIDSNYECYKIEYMARIKD